MLWRVLLYDNGYNVFLSTFIVGKPQESKKETEVILVACQCCKLPTVRMSCFRAFSETDK